PSQKSACLRTAGFLLVLTRLMSKCTPGGKQQLWGGLCAGDPPRFTFMVGLGDSLFCVIFSDRPAYVAAQVILKIFLRNVGDAITTPSSSAPRRSSAGRSGA